MVSLAYDETDRGRYYKNHFIFFSVICSLNHALNYIVTSYASSLLSIKLGGIVLGLNWILNSFSGLLIASPIVKIYGYRISMIISLFGYSIQIFTLFLAIQYPNQYTTAAVLFGSVIAGFTSAIWWTAQGICFEVTCNHLHSISNSDGNEILNNEDIEESLVNITSFLDKLTSIDNIDSITDMQEKSSTSMKEINVIRSDLSSLWTIIYQVSDIIIFLILSLIPIFTSISLNMSIFGLVIIGFFTSILGFKLDPLGNFGEKLSYDELIEAVTGVFKQMFITDVRSILLAPFIFNFGFAVCIFSSYFNANYISNSSSLGIVFIGCIESISYFIAALSAPFYAYVSNNFEGGQHYVMQFGSISYLICGILFIYNDRNIDSNSPLSIVLLIILRIFYGFCRGVFEGACRALYAEMWQGSDLSIAFSSQTLLAGLSGGVLFFVTTNEKVSIQVLSFVLITSSILAIIFHIILLRVVGYRSKMSWKVFLRIINPFTSHDKRYTSPLLNSSSKDDNKMYANLN